MSLTISDRLPSLLSDAIEFASGKLRKHDEPFKPFVVAYDRGSRVMTVLDEVEESAIRARGLAAIGERRPECAVLCYHGHLTLDNARTGAIFAIGCEMGTIKSDVFARPYRPKGFLRPMWFGQLTRSGVVDNPLRIN